MLTIFFIKLAAVGVAVVVVVVVVSSSEVCSVSLRSVLYSEEMPSRIFWASSNVVTSYFQSQSLKLSSSLMEAGH